MASKKLQGRDDHHENDDDHHDGWNGDNHGHHDKGDFDFDFEIPDNFKIDLDDLNLKSLGKITDYDISHKSLSVTFGNVWTFDVEGSGLDFTLKSGSKIPVVTGGTVDSFSIDGPGKADFSISDLDLSAKSFYNALVNLNVDKLLDLVLGGNETISGSGFGDYLYGGKGNDTILGNKGTDYLLGGAGNDHISGGKGNDCLLGGNGADTFVLEEKSGKDLIGDFDASSDKLDLSAYGFTGSVEDFLDEHTQDSHGDRCHGGKDGEDGVVIDLGDGDMVKLEGVSRWDLSEDNLLL
jgi:Ca2+-binding RTX toxin-like protein